MPDWAQYVRRNLRLRHLRPEREAEIVEDLAGQLDEAYREALERGLTEEQAEAAAIEHVADWASLASELVHSQRGKESAMTILQHKVEDRDVATRGRFSLLSDLCQDISYGLRMLRKSPGFTAVAVLTLALGIGANIAIFAVVYSVLVQPLPYPHADSLVWLTELNAQMGEGEILASPPTFLDWQGQQRTFSGLSVVSQDALTLTGDGEAVKLPATDVSAGFFSLMAVHPELGRDFRPSDDRVDAAPVIILSDQLWRARFGADPRIIGRSIILDDKGFAVVGVAPPGFEFPRELGWKSSLWVPVIPRLDPEALTERGAHFLPVIGRLKPDESLAAARADIAVIELRIAQDKANDYEGWKTNLLPLKQHIVGDVSLALWVLLGAVAVVLFIACANIANLVLARNAARVREIGIRRSLGATGGRLVRQLLTESLLLAIFGGVIGILIAYGGLRGLLVIAPQNLPRFAEIQLSSRVLAFAILLSAMAGTFLGVAPAWQAAIGDPADALKGQKVPLRLRAYGIRRRLSGRALVIAEIALTLVLLTGASLMLKSLLRLVSVNPGFSPRNVITFQFSLDPNRYTHAASQTAFFQDLLRSVRALPGIQSAAVAKDLPMLQSMSSIVSINGGSWSTIQAQQATVGPEYFETVGIPLSKGRYFDSEDEVNSQPVAILNESFVRQFMPRQDPLGERVETHFLPLKNRLVVGVVGDVHQFGPASSPPPEIYVPFSQAPNAGMTLLAHTAKSAELLIPAVKEVVATLDKNQAIDKITTMESLMSQSLAQPRFYAFLLGIFANLALLLAAIGTYGVVGYWISQRTHEIGIRMALGANPRDIVRMVLGEGLLLAFIGLGIGVAGALALTRSLRSLLFEIKPTDPATFIGAAVLLALVALAACYIPARRAMRLDPTEALRDE